ncbi:hypothetical protein [Streptomyces sp. NPDC002172]
MSGSDAERPEPSWSVGSTVMTSPCGEIQGHGKALRATTWQRLVAAAGGADQVAASCAEQPAGATASRAYGGLFQAHRPTSVAGPPSPAYSASAHRNRLGWTGLTALVAVAVAVHLGLAGALRSAPDPTSWAMGAAPVVIATTRAAVLTVGRRLHRRGRRRA